MSYSVLYGIVLSYCTKSDLEQDTELQITVLTQILDQVYVVEYNVKK